MSIFDTNLPLIEVVSLPLSEVVINPSWDLLGLARIQLKLEVFQLGSAKLGLARKVFKLALIFQIGLIRAEIYHNIGPEFKHVNSSKKYIKAVLEYHL